MSISSTLALPCGFRPVPDIVGKVRTAGTSVTIPAGALCVFDFLNGTNDPDALVDPTTGIPIRNGFTTVLIYTEATHLGDAHEYCVALDEITTDASGNPVKYGRVQRYGVIKGLAIADGDIVKGKTIMPATATAGQFLQKPEFDITSVTTGSISHRAALGMALTTGADGATFNIWFNGYQKNAVEKYVT